MPEPSNSWPDFLVRHGVILTEGMFAEVASVARPQSAPGAVEGQTGFFTAVAHLGTLAVEGDDAADFLHNQLTNDVLNLADERARLAGYCSPKGRLLATLLLWKSANQILLTLPRDILPAIQKRLQMFVLRAKVRITDISDEKIILGLQFSSNTTATNLYPDLPSHPYAVTHPELGTIIRLPDAQANARYYLLGDYKQATEAWLHLSASMSLLPTSVWRWTDIMAGIPHITKATQEQFVPQMINFEAIGGVNFRKGCYPGQEIVARSQYLGKFKRRMFIASLSETDDKLELLAGSEVFSDQDPDQPCGMIVNAERGPDGRYACLIEMKLDAMLHPVHIASANGPLLTFGELPYALPEPE